MELGTSYAKKNGSWSLGVAGTQVAPWIWFVWKILEVRYNYLQTDINGERDENGNLNEFNLQMAIS
jgi:hypothetical protein